MNSTDSLIRLQTPQDLQALTALHEHAFGPGRYTRTAYRIREGCRTEPALNLWITKADGTTIGAVQFTPVVIGGTPGGLLLGPLVIRDEFKNRGFGLQLMLHSLKRARDLDYKIVLLVGDLPYYARAGFVVTPQNRIVMPGPVDPARLLHAELAPEALQHYAGAVRGIPVSGS